MSTPRRWPIPASQDPFVNTPLVRVGTDASGTEWFWISTWNAASATTGLLVSAEGDHRRFSFEAPHWGFYSAVAEDVDTLWLCGDLSRVVRLDLRTGRYETFATGAPAALVFAGMAFDPQTGKLFAAAFPDPDRVAFSFDTRTRRTARLYRNVVAELYQTASVRRPDGTVSHLMYNPDIGVLHWDPQEETLTPALIGERLLGLELPYSNGQSGIFRVITSPDGAIRMPGGWYDPAADALVTGPEPEEELTWFARCGSRAWGVSVEGADARIGVWDLDTGRVEMIATIADGTIHGVNLTADGDVLSVSLYGVIRRHDGTTGRECFSRPTPTTAVGRVDCLRRIDRRRLLGTPFITQRFWELDLVTGDGVDRGRAAAGPGEVLQTWRIGTMVYLAAYSRAELTAYDPDQPVCFGTNPRVVAQAPTGMRPIAAADDGRHLFFSSSHHYGHLGGVLTRYDTDSGEAVHHDDPLPDLTIASLVRDPASGVLLAGTTIHADCGSAQPRAVRAALARIDPRTLAVVDRVELPERVEWVRVVGLLDAGRALCLATRPGDDTLHWFAVATDALSLPDAGQWQPLPGDAEKIVATDRPGRFILVVGGRHDLWDMSEPQRIAVLADEPGTHLAHVEDDDLFLVTDDEIIVHEGVLAV